MKGLKLALTALLFVAGAQASSLLDQARGYVDKGKALVDQGKTYLDKGKDLYNQGKAALPQVKDYATQAQGLYDKYGHLVPTNTLREGANTLFSTAGEWAGR